MVRALAAAVAAVAVAVAGCFLSPDPRYCEESSQCTDPARPFCDVAGEFEESGFHGHTCIEVPGGSCEASTECPAGLPICELAENQCRLCMSSDECAERGDGLGVCAGSGRCVECEQSIDCAAGQPICDDGECGACEDDDQCEARDPQAPVCDGGACRGCEGAADCIDPAAPICDLASGACRGCQAHGECGSGVCDSAAAECVVEADVVYVEPGGTDIAGCGDRTAACQTIGFAITQVAGSRNWVAIATGTYAENVAVTGAEINFAGPTDAVIDPTAANQPVIAVTGAAQVKIDGLTLRDASGVSGRGVNCTGGSTATIRNAKIDDNAGAGIATDDCTLTIERSSISANPGGGLDIDNSSFTVRNNFIVGNGSGVAGTLFGGISIDNGGGRTQILEHNTIADNSCTNVAGAARGVRCTTTTPMTAHSNILFGGLGAAQTAGNCSHRFSIVEGAPATDDNITDAPIYVSAGTDYHLAAGSPGIDVGDPASVVLEDVDGDRRPFNGRVDMGADEVVPAR